MAEDKPTNETDRRKVAPEETRARLLLAAEGAVRSLDGTCGLDARTRVEAVDLALYALRVLGELRAGDDGEPLDPTRLHRAWVALHGGKPDALGDDPAMAYRLIADALEDAVVVAKEQAVGFVRCRIGWLDPALARAPHIALAAAIERARSSSSGAIADLLRATKALRTCATEDRSATQRRIDAALARRK